MTTIALITTSKGRLHHIKQTLPLMVEQDAFEVIVVDYSCPDRTGDWVEAHFPQVKVVRITDDEGFCLSRARNMGASNSNSELLAFVDGDVKVLPGWLAWIEQHFEGRHFYLSERVDGVRDTDTFGTVVCPRSEFDAIGGFDEVYRGWGSEDIDLYERLAQNGVQRVEYPARFVEAIRHSDEERAGWGHVHSKDQKMVVNRCYRAAKERFQTQAGTPKMIPLKTRLKLMEITVDALAKWFAEGAAGPLAIRYSLRRSRPLWLPTPYTLVAADTFVLHVSNGGE